RKSPAGLWLVRARGRGACGGRCCATYGKQSYSEKPKVAWLHLIPPWLSPGFWHSLRIPVARRRVMPFHLDHTIVPAHDKEESARFFARIFGLEYKGMWGP